MKIKPTKRSKSAPVPVKRPKVYPALDAKGRQFKVGQRVRYGSGEVTTVEEVFMYRQWEIVRCRMADGDLSQPHPPWCTILDDAPSGSLRDRIRGLRA